MTVEEIIEHCRKSLAPIKCRRWSSLLTRFPEHRLENGPQSLEGPGLEFDKKGVRKSPGTFFIRSARYFGHMQAACF
jgi:hypothetical protein